MSLSIRCECTPVYDAQYEATDHETPTETVVSAVAAAADVSPTDLTPLHEAVDPDAVNRLVERGDGGGEVVLGFEVADLNVFVRDDGAVHVCDPAPSADPTRPFDRQTDA